MLSIAEFTLRAGDFPLGRVFETDPDARFELDRVIPADDTFMPYFWVYSSNLTDVLSILEDLPELRSVVLMEDLGDKGLFRAEWNPQFKGVMDAIAATDVTVLSAVGSTDGWVFELRTDSSQAFSDFQEHCEDHGVGVELTRLSRVSEESTDLDDVLTREQREALVLAFEKGYYDDPRGTDLDSLAAQLGISRQAFAARLRRGYRNFVESSLVRGRRDDGS